MTSDTANTINLILKCRNRIGIAASVTSFLFERGLNIRSSDQFHDDANDMFFLRVAFDHPPSAVPLDMLRDEFSVIAEAFEMGWWMRSAEKPRNVLILVSKLDHCLVDLLYRHRIGELPMCIVGIVSNHPVETFSEIDIRDLQFHYLPVTKDTKTAQEKRLLEIVEQSGAELVVLARYMQVLSDELSQRLAGRCINIHHSFLPGFKGARPYHQAHHRGVKLIGATAHYVTPDLDEGPIIEQDVQRISHADTPQSLIRKGRDIERRVLARGVRYHLEDRVLLDGSRCVVFPD